MVHSFWVAQEWLKQWPSTQFTITPNVQDCIMRIYTVVGFGFSPLVHNAVAITTESTQISTVLL